MGTTNYLGTLQYDSGGSVYVDIGELVEFTPQKRSAQDVKDSHLASPGATHTYQPGFLEPGEISFRINFKKTDYATLDSHYKGRAKRNYRVRYNDGTTATTGSNMVGEGYVKELGDEQLSRDSDNPIQTIGVIKASGVWTFTQAT